MPQPIGAYDYGFIPRSSRSSQAGGDDYTGVVPTYKRDQIGGAQDPSSQYDPDTGRNVTPHPPKDDSGITTTPLPSASGSPNDFGQAQSFDHGFTNFQALVNANRQAILGPGSGYAPAADPTQAMTGGMSMLDSALNNIYQRNSAMPTGKTWNGASWDGQDAPTPTPLPGQAGYVAPKAPPKGPSPKFTGDDAGTATPAAPQSAPATAPTSTPGPQQPANAAPSPSSPAQGSVPPRVQGESPADRQPVGPRYKFLGDY